MKTLVKTGLALAVVATLMTAAATAVLTTHASDSQPVKHGKLERASETRTVAANIDSVSLEGNIDLTITQGPVAGLTVSGAKGMLHDIETVQDGDTLRIRKKSRTTIVMGYHRSQQTKVTLTLPSLQKLALRGVGDSHVSGFSGDGIQLAMVGTGDLDFKGQYKKVSARLEGSGDLHLNGGNSESVDLELVGAGDMVVGGQSKVLTTKLLGSGDIDASGLHGDSVTVDLIGAGDISVHAKQSAALSIKGSGDIDVHGNPTQRSTSKVGPGEVTWH